MSDAVRVLQIEDSQGDVALVKAVLREAGERGFELDHAPRLAVGLECLSRKEYDIVLLDLGLPDSRGIDTFQRARAAAPNVPIIVFSGLDDEELALRAVQEGAQEYLVKGKFDGALLARAIRYAIGRFEAERALREHERRFREDLERQVKERTEALERSLVQLRIADRLSAIGTLAAGLGHDMNNMLLPLRCRLDSLDAMNLPEAAQQQLVQIRRSTEYLQQLTDGLRLLALDPEDAAASSETTSIESWWSSVGGLLSKAVQKPARLECSITPGLPTVNVPGHRLTQAVLNLIVNAAEAVQEKAGANDEAVVQVWARAGTKHRVLLGVTDNGRGMSEEVRRRAVEPFFTTKTRGLGTGLGLALVRGVVAEAGGDLWIESTQGVGTTIVLELPAAAAAAEADAGEGQHALITLTDPRAAAVIEMMLREIGCSTSRSDGSTDQPVDILVCDGQSEACEEARWITDRGRRVVWVGSGAPAGATMVIADPFDLEEVRATVQQLSPMRKEVQR